jgi:soluble lytic murein transglycosylase
LKDNWQGEKSLHNPEVNIKYGSYYYKQLLNRFNNHFALATAAYNAGPNRANKWLPVDKPVAADIWIETIPFKETRKYVSSVLSYAIIYQQQMGSGNLRLKNLMQDVKPVALPVDYY